MEPSDYKHVVLRLIFLKYISDVFEARHAKLLADDPKAAEHKDEYLADSRKHWIGKIRRMHVGRDESRPGRGVMAFLSEAQLESALLEQLAGWVTPAPRMISRSR